MIITCPHCEKKFEVDSNLIPEKGRMLKCGSCDQTWFFNPSLQKGSQDSQDIKTDKKSEIVEDNNEITSVEEQTKNETKKINKSSNFGVGKILSYLIVIIISFIGVIVILETFKTPLGNIFPGLEFMLYSLFETIKDIFLFFKNLFL
tara:strand:+ start:55 stop:495 length:441 start_codon:yes stop_codon:yes gene_type:complete